MYVVHCTLYVVHLTCGRVRVLGSVMLNVINTYSNNISITLTIRSNVIYNIFYNMSD